MPPEHPRHETPEDFAARIFGPPENLYTVEEVGLDGNPIQPNQELKTDLDLTPDTPRSRWQFGRYSGRTALAGVLLVAGGAVVLQEEPSRAEGTQTVAETLVPRTVYRTGGDGVWLHESPGLSTPLKVVMPEGAQFNVDCFVTGQDNVNGNRLWLQGSYNGQTGAVTDYYIDTHWNTTQDLVNQGIEECGTQPQVQAPEQAPAPRAEPQPRVESYDEPPGYDRQKAVSWALAHSQDVQPTENLCTWFVSQALIAGDIKEDSEFNDDERHGLFGKYPGPEVAWFVPKLRDYLLKTYPESDWIKLDLAQNSVPHAEIGDLISYDYENDGELDHFAMVTSISPGSYPNIAEQGNVSPGRASKYKERGWTYSPNLSPPNWTQTVRPKVVAYLLHIEMDNTY